VFRCPDDCISGRRKKELLYFCDCAGHGQGRMRARHRRIRSDSVAAHVTGVMEWTSPREKCTCLRHASDACQPHVLGAGWSSRAPTFPGLLLLRRIAWQEATFFISPAHGRCCTLFYYTRLNVNHVLGALAIYRTASFLWHPHRFLSLLRNDVCHLHVQETYRGQCDDKG
jgi:hypothetical protein